tara:strand:- start:124 stop:354 length:231 start_codon:yes stop_codon:yes gene_type:complete
MVGVTSLTGIISSSCCLAAERSRARQPVALGDDIDVPFISWFLAFVHPGTLVIAPPGAIMETPRSPSSEGPTDDHV